MANTKNSDDPIDKHLDAIADQLVSISKRLFDLEVSASRNTAMLEDFRKRIAQLEKQAAAE